MVFHQSVKYFLTLQIQHNHARLWDIHFLHGTGATTSTITTIISLPPTTITHHTTVATTASTTTTTYESFVFTPVTFARNLHFHIFHFQSLREVSHENVFHTRRCQFQQLIQETPEPCHVQGLRAADFAPVRCAKKSCFSARDGPASGRQGFCDMLLFVLLSFTLSFETPGWIKKTAKQ